MDGGGYRWGIYTLRYLSELESPFYVSARQRNDDDANQKSDDTLGL